jgi:hypothetical protein
MSTTLGNLACLRYWMSGDGGNTLGKPLTCTPLFSFSLTALQASTPAAASSTSYWLIARSVEWIERDLPQQPSIVRFIP